MFRIERKGNSIKLLPFSLGIIMNTTITSPKNQSLVMIRQQARQHIDHVFNQLLPDLMTGKEDIEHNKVELKWLTFNNEDFFSAVVERLISGADNDLICFLKKALPFCPYGLLEIVIGNVFSFRDDIFQEKRRKQYRKVMTPSRMMNSFGGEIIAKWRKGSRIPLSNNCTMV